jgi:C4-dicarboxylate-specific signal transduction histidine kinase
MVLQRVVASRQRACRARNIEVVRHYAENVPRVQGDPLLLHQVFLNLLVNAEDAVSAAERHGLIAIATKVTAGGNRVTTTIRDSGKGIRADALLSIFEPFHTTKEVGKGTGLGLAIAYGIVHEHGGTISAANHPDGGAVLTVDLPALPARDPDHG